MKLLRIISACLVLAWLMTASAQQTDQSGSGDANNGGSQPDAAAPNGAAPAADENQNQNQNQTPPGGFVPPNGGMSPDQGQPQEGDAQNGRSAQPRATVILPRHGSSATGEGADASAFAPPTNSLASGSRDLHLNFRNAPIEMVLNYLSDAAGFIIELDTRVSGRVDVWSTTPVTKNEAVELLNSVLNRNGYAVVRNGRTLRVMTKDEAIHSDIPVRVSNDPETIPKTDEIVTQIIPIRFVEAKQLIADLSPLVSSRATIIANEAGNSLIVTDTQANIRHLVEVIKAIDSSAEDVTEVRVFHLQYHDPNEVANLLTSLFSDQGTGNQTPIRFGGGGGGGGGGGFRGGFIARMMAAQGGGGAAAGNNNATDRIKKHARVAAVPDQRTQSVVVTAAKDLMEQISDMIAQLDQQESPKVAHVSVIHLENADPQQVQQVLQDMFQSGNAARRGNSQNSALMNRMQQNQTGSGSSSFGGGNGGGGFGGGGGGGGGGFRGGGFGGQ